MTQGNSPTTGSGTAPCGTSPGSPFNPVSSPINSGLTIIEASAGTGKTYSISYLVPRLLLEDPNLTLPQILLVTFTNDAAAELESRVRKVLLKLDQAAPPPSPPPTPPTQDPDPALTALLQRFNHAAIRQTIRRALLQSDRMAAMTIHSFCASVLQHEGALCGYPAPPEILPSDTSLLHEILAAEWETTVFRDPLLSALAANGFISFNDEIQFIAQTLKHPALSFEPPPQAPAAVLAQIQSFATAHNLQADIADFRNNLLPTLTSNLRNKDFPADAEIHAALDTLLQPFTPAHLAALQVLTSQVHPKNIAKRTRAGNDAAKALENHPLRTKCTAWLRLIESYPWHRKIALAQTVRQRLRESLTQNRAITYDGLISTVHEALHGPNASALLASLRQRYRIAIIDESQDTDPTQLAIFQTIFEGMPLILIGDPKQAIYGFRGADLNTYLAAKRQPHTPYTLTTTYRAPQNLVEAVNALFHRPSSFLHPEIQFLTATSGLSSDIWLDEQPQATPSAQPSASPAHPRIEAWLFAPSKTTKKEAREPLLCRAVAHKIATLLNQNAQILKAPVAHPTSSPPPPPEARPVKPKDFAVLVSTNKQAALMLQHLRHSGIPAVISRSGSIFATQEARELLLVLRAIADPASRSLTRTALLTDLLGYTLADLNDPSAADTALAPFPEWLTLWETEGLPALLARLDRDRHITERLARFPDAERRITNLRQLTTLLQNATAETGPEPAPLLRWLTQKIATSASEKIPPDEYQLQLETEADAVQILTMHSVKGLEFPLVFCPFLWDSSEPKGTQKLSTPNGTPLFVDLDQADPSYTTTAKRHLLEERLRLAYVAFTRAQVKVWFAAGIEGSSRSKVPPSCLDWLLCPPPPQDGPITDDVFQNWLNASGDAGRLQRHQTALEALQCHIATVLDPPDTPVLWQCGQDPAPSLAAETPPSIPQPWSVTSFSALTRETHPHADPSEPSVASALPHTSSAVAPTSPSASASSPNSFTTAPAGTAVGTAIHTWLQKWDFSPLSPNALTAHFEQFPLPPCPGGWPNVVTPMLEALAQARLPALGTTVAQACANPAASEWHFILPLTPALSPATLADLFERNGYPDYAPYLRSLSFPELQGLLEGFIDRIVEHKGRWGVIDWKTNHLGETSADYYPNALRDCAMRCHYLLQAHLYLVALRRYLRLCAPNATLAAAWLVFLRGIQSGTCDAILEIPANPSLLDELEKIFLR